MAPKDQTYIREIFEKPEPISRSVALATLVFALICVAFIGAGVHVFVEWVLS